MKKMISAVVAPGALPAAGAPAQARDTKLGANAVVNIVSNYQNVENSSETEFECHDGAILSGVALKGDFVKIAQ